MIPRVYDTYRPDYAINAVNPHLHNVPLQIAAERGLPALAIWIWFVIALAVRLFRLFRTNGDRVLAATGLAALAAMLAAGLFEYNFGDSEFLMLFLVLVTLPFAGSKHEETSTNLRS
jgi:O-antigen ligase